MAKDIKINWKDKYFALKRKSSMDLVEVNYSIGEIRSGRSDTALERLEKLAKSIIKFNTSD